MPDYQKSGFDAPDYPDVVVVVVYDVTRTSFITAIVVKVGSPVRAK